MGIINIIYIFTLPNNKQVSIELRLDEDDFLLLNNIPDKLPYWTSLDFHQCPNCTLVIEENPHCPSAVHYVKLLPIFQNVMSYEEIDVKVITPERMTIQKISAQKAVSSVMGLINATSGCPHTVFFRPMARFHLPFSNAFETTYRATSMYILAQYFLLKRGHNTDFDLEGLKQIYSNIQMIDEAMIARLQFASEKDVAINALANLDALAKLAQMSMEESLEEFRQLFTHYLDRNIANIGTHRRKERRTKLQVPLHVIHQQQYYAANTTDLSEKGLCIKVACESSLKEGDTIGISILDLTMKARVAWVKRWFENSLIGLQKID